MEYDHAASFDLDENGGRCIRWPLYNLYADAKFDPIVEERDKFCCMVVSNPRNDKRIKFYHALGKYRTVDSGGKTLNNVGGPVADKMAFIRKYKFCIAFENAYYPGYTTEKLLQAKQAGCIPIYWGNPEIALDFNTESFVNANGFRSFSQCIEFIRHLDSDSGAFTRVQSQPLLRNNEYTPYSDPARFRRWLNAIVAEGKAKRKAYFLSWPIQMLSGIKTNLTGCIGETRFRNDMHLLERR
jgi:hypothetical protein